MTKEILYILQCEELSMKKKSYTNSPSNSPFIYKSCPELLEERFIANPEKVAIKIYKEDLKANTLSYAGLHQGSLEVAAALRRLIPDIKCGDRVGIIGSNTSDLHVSIHAIFSLGAVVVLIPQYAKTGQELLTFLQTTNCKCLVFQQDVLDTSLLEPVGTLGVRLVSYGVGADKKNLTGILSLETTRDTLTPSEINETKNIKDEILPDSPAAVFFTSGSTGIPKTVIYTHFQLINNVSVYGKQLSLTAKDIFFTDMATIHVAPFLASLWFLVSDLLFISLDTHVTKTDIETILAIVERERCTAAMFFGYLLFDILKVGERAKPYLTSLRVLIAGGQTFNIQTVIDIHRILPDTYFANGYGATEIGYAAANMEPLEDQELGFIGPPLPSYEMKIVGDHGETLPLGEIGELHSRSFLMALGYTHGENFQKMTSSGGWYATGDMALMNDRGHIKIVGRKVDFIKRAAIKIFPAEIENIISEHPDISSVQVIGVPDERIGEELYGCVILKQGSSVKEADLLEWFAGRFKDSKVGDNRAPKFVEILEDFPRLPSGKVSRKELKAKVHGRLN